MLQLKQQVRKWLCVVFTPAIDRSIDPFSRCVCDGAGSSWRFDRAKVFLETAVILFVLIITMSSSFLGAVWRPVPDRQVPFLSEVRLDDSVLFSLFTTMWLRLAFLSWTLRAVVSGTVLAVCMCSVDMNEHTIWHYLRDANERKIWLCHSATRRTCSVFLLQNFVWFLRVLKVYNLFTFLSRSTVRL